jgi:glutaminase
MNLNVTSATSQLNEWILDCKPLAYQGALASYIPALQRADLSHLGICILAQDGTLLQAGESHVPFTLQSMSKVINFLAACESRGLNSILDNVDVEPTGDAFDSMIRLESHKPGKPFNPLINAGAITVASMLPGKTASDKLDTFKRLLGQMIGRQPEIDEEIFRSEMKHGHRNRAMAHYLKGLGYLDSDVDVALEVYTKECAMNVTAEEVARIGLVFALDGYHADSDEQLVSKEAARITKSLMVTCGTYNASGKIAAFVGVPTKSGVSGGILAAVPERKRSLDKPFTGACGVGIYGPALDSHGNSIAGVELLKHVSKEWDFSIW